MFAVASGCLKVERAANDLVTTSFSTRSLQKLTFLVALEIGC